MALMCLVQAKIVKLQVGNNSHFLGIHKVYSDNNVTFTIVGHKAKVNGGVLF